MTEAVPCMTINGVELTTAQVQMILVAFSNFLVDLAQEDGLPADTLGHQMRARYRVRAGEIQALMQRGEA
jgi:hypothetical protein